MSGHASLAIHAFIRHAKDEMQKSIHLSWLTYGNVSDLGRMFTVYTHIRSYMNSQHQSIQCEAPIKNAWWSPWQRCWWASIVLTRALFGFLVFCFFVKPLKRCLSLFDITTHWPSFKNDAFSTNFYQTKTFEVSHTRRHVRHIHFALLKCNLTFI